VSITILAENLQRMFQQVTPHMDDPEDGHPFIASVRLESRDGWLYTVATDRYTIAATRRSVLNDGPRAGNIPAHLVPAFTAFLDAASSYGDDVTLTLPPAGAKGACSLELATTGRKELTVEYEADSYKDFPDWRKLLHGALTAEPGTVPITGFTTEYLARWQHAAERLVAWQEAGHKPIVFVDLVGEFVGMQMPTSAHRDGTKREDVASAWTAATAPTAEVDGSIYDLDRTWSDKHGDPWTYSGKDTPDGMPLMVIDGIEDDPHPLDRLVWTYGPLYARGL
jgi:hypothetical protein